MFHSQPIWLLRGQGQLCESVVQNPILENFSCSSTFISSLVTNLEAERPFQETQTCWDVAACSGVATIL